MQPRVQMTLSALLMGIAYLGGSALAADPPTDKPKEERIIFANLGGIQNWQADGDHGLYIQGRTRKDWYYAKVMSPCLDLPWVESIGFVTEPTGDFDKFSSILVKHRECRVMSLVRSDPPPKKEPAKKDLAKEKPNEAK